MKNICKIKRIILPVGVFFIGIMLLAGCSPVKKIIKNMISDTLANESTNCKVFSVDSSIGTTKYICSNSTSTYIYHDGAIYDYETMQLLTEVGSLEFMACNDEVLYYSEATQSGQLYCYDFSDKTSIMVSDEYRVVSMKAYGDDIFLLKRTKEDVEHGLTSEVAMGYPYELMYFHKDEEGVNVTEWAKEQEPVNVAGEYEEYEFNGYTIACDTTIEQESPQLVYVECGEDFKYSCYAYHTYVKIDDAYLCLTRDVSCRYKDENNHLDMVHDLEGDNEDYCGLSPAYIGFSEGKAYMLVQYARGNIDYEQNPDVVKKMSDALFCFSPVDGESQLLYQTKNKEQIAGFSLEKNCLYLLRDDGLFEYNLDTEEEHKVIERAEYLTENQGYDDLLFEYYDNSLIVFYDPRIGSDKMVFLKELD
ncbi:MAG: hypothetical protein E7264_07005 [Lachnospiraceae bacterium]|nr:hypothetical protein [Lachnospiraceae bacterium]